MRLSARQSHWLTCEAEFTVNCSKTQFLASYVAGHYNPRGPVLNVSMKGGGEHREYLFKNPKGKPPAQSYLLLLLALY